MEFLYFLPEGLDFNWRIDQVVEQEQFGQHEGRKNEEEGEKEDAEVSFILFRRKWEKFRAISRNRIEMK